MKQKVFVTHKLPGGEIEKLRKDFDVEVWPGIDISRKDLLNKAKGVSGIISLLTEKIDRDVMEAAGDNLKVIANYAVGYDNVDCDEADKRGIVVTNTPGVLTESVAEHVIALMFAVLKRVVEGDKFIRGGKFAGWEPDLLVGTGVREKVMGVVGLGRIGRWTVKLAKGLGMKVIYNSRTRDEEYEEMEGVVYHSLEQLLEMSDVVSLSVPLCKETEGMIGKKELKLMKRSAILINTARGPVVNENDLIEALEMGKIAGAGLDVFWDETKIPKRLIKLSNVVLTPHIASATIEVRLAMAEMVVDSVRAVLN
ncbi:D-glycerate dehydrogenase, partial [Patescibacteria group bacterium]|nr:D-glycerate dehydrogenase [Patescibacteria group bacterium]